MEHKNIKHRKGERKMKTTQNQRILNYLKEFGSITQLEALKDLGIMRLASRISELRAMGTKIVGGFEGFRHISLALCQSRKSQYLHCRGISVSIVPFTNSLFSS